LFVPGIGLTGMGQINRSPVGIMPLSASPQSNGLTIMPVVTAPPIFFGKHLNHNIRAMLERCC